MLCNSETKKLSRIDEELLSTDLDGYRLTLQPPILDSNELNHLTDASKSVIKLISSSHKRIFNGRIDSLYKYFDISPSLLDKGDLEQAIADVLYRPDFIRSSDGWKCLEVNAGNAGGWVISVANTAYVKKLATSSLRSLELHDTAMSLFSFLIQKTINFLSGKSLNSINTLISLSRVESSEFTEPVRAELESAYERALKKFEPKLTGGLYFSVDFEGLKLDSEWPQKDNIDIHAIYEEAISSNFKRMQLIRLSRRRSLYLNPGMITRYLNDKRHFALLSENMVSSFFDDLEKEQINSYIPWTRRLVGQNTNFQNSNISLVEFVDSNKDILVLKRAFSHGGKDVYMGNNIAQYKWSEIINDALISKDFIVQERVNHIDGYMKDLNTTHTMRKEVIWGPFILGDEYIGGFVRVLDSDGYTSDNEDPSIINSRNSDGLISMAPMVNTARSEV